MCVHCVSERRLCLRGTLSILEPLYDCECVNTRAATSRGCGDYTSCHCVLASISTQEAGDNGSTSLDSELLRPPPHPQPSMTPRPGPGGVTTFLPLGWAGQAPGPTHPDLVPPTHLQRKLSTHTLLPQGSH